MQNTQTEIDANKVTKEIQTWEDIPENIDLLRGIYSYGYENPSPIQAKGILPMLDGLDILAQAQSGTGKTGCFTIGCLGRINISEQNTQAMILSPTRELSIQTKQVVDSIGSQMKGLKMLLPKVGRRNIRIPDADPESWFCVTLLRSSLGLLRLLWV